MDFGIYAGDTSKTIYIRLRDSTTGLAQTGLVFNSAGASAYYTLPLADDVQITLVTLALPTTAWASGGFVEVNATTSKGLYRLDLPDAAIASGDFVIVSIEFDGIIEESVEIELHTRKVNTIEVGGTTQTAGDIVAAVITNATGVDIAADIIALKAETVLIVADTNELQGDWTDAGRLDAILDIVAADVVNIDGAAMRGTDSAALASVVGALADAASAGEVTAVDTLVQYVKQIINTLEGAPGVPVMLAAAAPANNVSIVEMVRGLYEDRTLAAASYFDPAADTVALVTTVTTVTTTTTNSDMRGTDSAALASDYTSARAGYLDNLNIGENVAGVSDVSSSVLVSGVSDSGSNTTMVDAARTEATTNHWKDKMIVFGAGGSALNVGHCGLITGFTPGSDTTTFQPAALAAITTEAYDILPWTQVNLVTATQTSIDNIETDTNSLNDTKIPQTLNLTASGNIGIDWANVENPTTVLDLSQTDIQLCDTVTTLTGHTAQTGDTFAQLPTGFSTIVINSGAVDSLVQGFINNTIAEGTADNIANNFEVFFDNANALTTSIIDDVENVAARLPAALVSGRMDSNVAAVDDSAPAAVNLKQSALALRVVNVQTAEAAANTNTVFDTDLPLENANYYGNASGGLVIAFVDGAAQKFQTRRLVASVTGVSNTRITLEEALDGIPADSDVAVVLGRITELE